MKSLNKMTVAEAIQLNEKGHTFLVEDGEVVCMRRMGSMGKAKVDLNFKELNILKHSLMRYEGSPYGTEQEKQEERDLLRRINLILDKLY